MAEMPLSSAGCATSRSVTSQPATAATWAIPEPIRPAPTTSTLPMGASVVSPLFTRHTGSVPLALVSLPSTGSGANYFYIPFVSMVVVGILALVLRWIMRPGRRKGARVADPSQGLLIGVVATAPPEAERVRRMLVEAGIRATSRPVASRRQVLVWPDDVDRALHLIAADRASRG